MNDDFTELYAKIAARNAASLRTMMDTLAPSLELLRKNDDLTRAVTLNIDRLIASENSAVSAAIEAAARLAAPSESITLGIDRLIASQTSAMSSAAEAAFRLAALPQFPPELIERLTRLPDIGAALMPHLSIKTPPEPFLPDLFQQLDTYIAQMRPTVGPDNWRKATENLAALKPYITAAVSDVLESPEGVFDDADYENGDDTADHDHNRVQRLPGLQFSRQQTLVIALAMSVLTLFLTNVRGTGSEFREPMNIVIGGLLVLIIFDLFPRE
jgi:hypothetical protein